MCGIFGGLGVWVRDREVGLRMAGRLRHRGPDETGIEILGDTLMGHTRLKILDLSETGSQPMATLDRKVWVVFNGEIYNHRELRARLEREGHSFRGRSDTEVIPHAYEKWGATFVEHLRGMFAIAVYDVSNRELFLYRDRFGIKPLFYAVTREGIAFSSEIGALREVPWVRFSPDPQALHDFLGLRYVPAPATFFSEVRSLEAGGMLRTRIGSDGLELKMGQFHRWEIAPDNSLGVSEVVEETQRLLRSAVGRQLESHVPLGGFLSGGIDSSLVCALAREHLGTVRTFNLRLPDARYDETGAAVLVAEHIGSEHITLEIDEENRDWDSVRALMSAAGQPFADSSLFGANAVCRAARRHLTVALSGDGGDEGFAGYDAYRALLKIGRLRKIPGFFWRGASWLLESLVGVGGPGVSVSGRLETLAAMDEVALIERQFGALSQQEIQKLCIETAPLPVRRHFEPTWRFEGAGGMAPVERLMTLAIEANVRLSLQNDFLPKVDTASMAESLEVRVPMLDEDLMEFALRVPWRLKVNGSAGKLPLRAVARTLLPPEVVDKPKHGFGVPLDLWFPPVFKKELAERMLAPSSPLHDVFRREVFAPWIQAFSAGKQVPGLSRQALHLRVMMLLTIFLFLSESNL